jgi:hypothetical protein
LFFFFHLVRPAAYGKFEGCGKRKDSSNEEEEGTGADGMEEIRSVLKEVDNKLHLLVVTVKANQIGMMEHFWDSILCLGSAIEAMHTRIQGLEQDVGDASEVLDKHNLVDLSEGIMKGVGTPDPHDHLWP